MRRVSWLFFVLMAAAVPASAATITFEGFADGTLVDNQFVGIGADFGNTALILTSGAVGGSLNEIDFPPVSGFNVAYNITGVLRVDAVGGSWSSASGWVTASAAATMNAFNSLDVLLSSTSTGGANLGGNTLLSLAVPNIAYVTFAAGGLDLVLDDFTFTPSTAVPEPATMLLLGSGLAGVAAHRRRRQRSPQ